MTAPLALVSERLPWRHTFISLKVRNFRLFATAHFLAVVAVWMQRIAQDWLVLQVSGSVTAVGITVALQFMPSLVLGPWGGVLADRSSKRAILIATQSAAGLLAVVLAVLSLGGHIAVWHIYAVALALGLVTVVDQPARQVFVNEMVGPLYLRNALSVISTLFQLGGLAGPALGGALLTLVGAGWSFAANAVACCFTVTMLCLMRTSELTTTVPAPRTKGMVRQGFRYAMAKPTIVWSWSIGIFVAVFALSLPVLLAAFANNVFHTGAGGYGLLNTLVAVGALAGAVASTRRRSLRLRGVVLNAGAYGLVLAASAFAPSPAIFGAAMVVAGYFTLSFLTSSNQLVQLSTNTAVRGRVMSVNFMVVVGAQALGGPLAGWLAQEFGPQRAIFICGIVPAMAAAVIGLLLARRVAPTALRRGPRVRHQARF
ncbi:MAG: MFS transporter [Acidobacteria bacterium]|nr:MFS transporter [Acidobacteriota bacterium]